MATRPSLQEVDPAYLPLGARVGPWCVRGWGGRGGYGTVYRVERADREGSGSFALKLALQPKDERFAREAELLSRIQHPHVPSLYDHGVYSHRSGDFPYLVMEWIDGTPLYAWAERVNPEVRQVLRLLAQMARALAATHAAGSVHRDVKGDNVLVRLADGHPFLTDFGAGHFRGAATITSRLLPPGTATYRSPEAWAFVHAFARHPTIHYPASACDDLFALGVTAYRLVTGMYPPPTNPGERGSEVWREGGFGPQPPQALNSRVSPEQSALVLRLLAIAPDERFDGRAEEAAEALEQAARREGLKASVRLFSTGAPANSSRAIEQERSGGERRREIPPGKSPSVALGPSVVQHVAAKEEPKRRELREEPHVVVASELVRSSASAPDWVRRGALAACVLLLAMVVRLWPHSGQERAQAIRGRDSREGGIIAVGDSGRDAPIATLSTEFTDERVLAVGSPMPEGPFPGQRKPPCNRGGEEVIRGGCWYALRNLTPPCKEDAYDWDGACYLPSYPPRRRPASDPQ
ncbi:serine/threonine-protein kinase [Hyalangium sp.]|uniref:serine/threonine protein kinase n=1 Tax=Hyalangium sp. TaxID=2028555 RepID=UPI002D279677|nr:serine/threonine-protein kinase [Hyalangium sp.]HYH95547.1 serine/threonine-protein kinase [Hyalangium sp.]